MRSKIARVRARFCTYQSTRAGRSRARAHMAPVYKVAPAFFGAGWLGRVRPLSPRPDPALGGRIRPLALRAPLAFEACPQARHEVHDIRRLRRLARLGARPAPFQLGPAPPHE